jgi:hypothetical protein
MKLPDFQSNSQIPVSPGCWRVPILYWQADSIPLPLKQAMTGEAESDAA